MAIRKRNEQISTAALALLEKLKTAGLLEGCPEAVALRESLHCDHDFRDHASDFAAWSACDLCGVVEK